MRKLTGKCKWILAVLLVTVSMAAGCNKTKDIGADVMIHQKHHTKFQLSQRYFPIMILPEQLEVNIWM